MEIVSETTIVLHLTLTEAEARAILVEPQDFQARLRAALAPIATARQTRKSLTLGKRASTPKAKAAGGRHYAPRERKPCPKCGRMMTVQGMTKHLAKCAGARPQA